MVGVFGPLDLVRIAFAGRVNKRQLPDEQDGVGVLVVLVGRTANSVIRPSLHSQVLRKKPSSPSPAKKRPGVFSSRPQVLVPDLETGVYQQDRDNERVQREDPLGLPAPRPAAAPADPAPAAGVDTTWIRDRLASREPTGRQRVEWSNTPRPVLSPRRPCSTSSTSFGHGAYLSLPRPSRMTFMMFTQTSSPM